MEDDDGRAFVDWEAYSKCVFVGAFVVAILWSFLLDAELLLFVLAGSVGVTGGGSDGGRVLYTRALGLMKSGGLLL